MAVKTDTVVRRIPLTDTDNLKTAIETECDLQASRDKHRRLAAAFTYEEELVLIFQRTPD